MMDRNEASRPRRVRPVNGSSVRIRPAVSRAVIDPNAASNSSRGVPLNEVGLDVPALAPVRWAYDRGDTGLFAALDVGEGVHKARRRGGVSGRRAREVGDALERVSRAVNLGTAQIAR